MTMYQDSWGIVALGSMQDFALSRVNQRVPLLGGALCPAYEYTFAISEDNAQTWRNPTQAEKFQLYQEIMATTQCCRGLATRCPLASLVENKP